MKRLLCTLALITCSLVSAALAADKPARPNILFIVSDDHRWDVIGAYGHQQVKTPVMDALAARGTKFTNTYCMGSMSGAVCSPSRTMLMTGRSLWRIPAPNGKPDGTPSMGQTFRDAGYATLFIGKAGNSYKAGNEQFETYVYNGEKDHVQAPIFMADRTIEWLKSERAAEKQRPFFIYLGPPVPHDPRVSPPEYEAMYDPAKMELAKNFLPEHPFDNGELRVRDEMLAGFPRTKSEMQKHLAHYYAIISHLDHHMGRIFDNLKAAGQLDNTLIVYTSDHGLACGGMHGLMGKQNLYEHNKAPLIFAGPGVPPGKTDALAYLYDLFPTLCDYAGLKIPARVEGQSLLPVIEQKKPGVRDTLFGAYRDCQRSLRDDRFKLIEYRAADDRHTQLYDLANDPDELTNLADQSQHEATLKRLRTELAAASKAYNDPIDWSAPFRRPAEPAKKKK